MNASAKKSVAEEASPILDLVGLLTDAVFADFVEGMKKACEPQKARPCAEEATAAAGR